MKLLENKNAIVCGSTKGIGKAIAEAFARNGCNLFLFSRDPKRLSEVKQEFEEKYEIKVEYLVADFNSATKVEEVITNFFDFKYKGKIDILINNVRGPMPVNLLDSSDDLIRETFERHIISSHILAKTVISNMFQNKTKGRIINICDNIALAPYPGLGLSFVRAAEIAWAKTLAMELAPYNITVNNILPGPTETEGLKKIIDKLAQNENMEYETKNMKIIEYLPMKRYAKTSDIANAALFLASDKSGYITGSNIKIDGAFNLVL